MRQANKLASPPHWLGRFAALIDSVLVEPIHHMRWSYLPPLLVYFAAGISGLTAIAGTFFIKERLGLSAEFLASLSFWAGLPWILKMPLGHLVDIIWKWKFALVYLGATLIGISLSIMYGLIARTETMTGFASVETWFVTSAILAPIGYVVQDVVADAMTVEAVPEFDDDGLPIPEDLHKSMHTTMQTLGRVAIISGTVAVALFIVVAFSGAAERTAAENSETYAQIYLLALMIPLISVIGVTIGQYMQFQRRRNHIRQTGGAEKTAAHARDQQTGTEPNYWIFGGSFAFAALTVGVALSSFRFSQELVFVGSLLIILFLINRLLKELPKAQRHTLVGTAAIIFVFRAVPLPGAGVTWWEIDILGFDQQFLATLTVITSVLTLAGMILLRPLIAKRTIAYVVLILTLASGILSLPNIGLYYGIHEWTSIWSGGVVDARFIAILDTMLESPLGQIAMIPMLAWIARNAPENLKATYFAVMASFTNLALSASSLGTKYLNRIFSVTREVSDAPTGEIIAEADYSQVGWLLITVALIGLAAPVFTILIIQASRFRTKE